MKSYRDLEIYKESKRLAIEVHLMTLQLPKFEMYEEGGQVRRSFKSVSKRINKFIQWVEESFNPDYNVREPGDLVIENGF